ncbi:MAG: hypothetical protein BWY79_00001 [Actinobacteria bacterium ADurb.Bin444]|nr:MAG: hypothetical protein BWY79_00001 [Actinobacteria bacterium ADurb.Bin444]
MRVTVGELRIQAHHVQQFANAFLALGAGADVVNGQWLAHDGPNRHTWIE